MTTITEIVHETLQKNCYLVTQIDEVFEALESLRTMQEEGEISLILENHEKKQAGKDAYVQKMITSLPSSAIQKCLITLIEERGTDFFIKNEFLDFLDIASKSIEGIEIVKIQLAIKFEDKDLKEMAEHFSLQTGNDIAFKVTVQPSLLGGSIIQYGNYIHDFSLKSRLDQVKTKWKKAVVE